MAPNFADLLNKPFGHAKRPVVLPIADYEGVITGFERGESTRNKTPFLRFNVRLTGAWPDSIPDDERLDAEGDPIDLSKRQLRVDYYVTDDALYRLEDFITSTGIATPGTPFPEILPQLVGQPVIVVVRQFINQRTNELGNTVEKLVGVSGA